MDVILLHEVQKLMGLPSGGKQKSSVGGQTLRRGIRLGNVDRTLSVS